MPEHGPDPNAFQPEWLSIDEMSPIATDDDSGSIDPSDRFPVFPRAGHTDCIRLSAPDPPRSLHHVTAVLHHLLQ